MEMERETGIVIDLKGIHHCADQYEVKEVFARILHEPPFSPPGTRSLNFRIELDINERAETRNVGTGRLTLPYAKVGELLIKLSNRKVDVSVRRRRVFLSRSRTSPPRRTVETLLKVPYQAPSADREREMMRRSLDSQFRVGQLQFGIWRERPSATVGRRGVFCVEWDRSYTEAGNALIWFDYDKKVLRIQLGDPYLETYAHTVVIKFSNLRKLWVGYDFGNPFVCFDLLNPAILEKEKFNRTLTGEISQDRQKFRFRIQSLDDAYKRIAPYAHHVRITLYQSEDLENFIRLCTVVGLQEPESSIIDAESHDYFSDKRLSRIKTWVKNLPWSVAFQIEAMLHNGLLTTEDILEPGLRDAISNLCKQYPLLAGQVLRQLRDELVLVQATESSIQLFATFQRISRERVNLMLKSPGTHDPAGSMDCYSVTFTPTRMSLEGPYAIQSNRVIRRYANYLEHFVRAEFRDEDRLQFRWDREVDGQPFVADRVGGILSSGFTLAGRHFEFLGYAPSALQHHTMWFINPFEHPTEGKISAGRIRQNLGAFTVADLTCPAKYAARLGQAFTSTDPSVKITSAQWREIPDVGRLPHLHTDGCGTISRQLGALIWKEVGKPEMPMPSVYQIRFLGYKGVVSIDDNLEDVMMCLRPSMRKFKVHATADTDIEIAQAFYAPNNLYLNRPLIMMLNDLGVKKKAFLELQRAAVAVAQTSRDSIRQLCRLLKAHMLGARFELVTLYERLERLGLSFDHADPSKCLESPFLDLLANCAISAVLRDIKLKAKIPVPEGWNLVGVADEGPAYISRNNLRHTENSVLTLEEGEIYACVKENSQSEPIYLKGSCVIGRSPCVHPGDVQHVRAIGKPSEDKICFFRNLKNCVVLPSKGARSLASFLGGGDVDGDMFQVIAYHPLQIKEIIPPAKYPPVETHRIASELLQNPKTGQIEQERVIPHVCDFIIQYINSDVLGLLSDRHLIRADQSSEGIFDKGCIELARLCSQAVDYPKNGKPVDPRKAPQSLIMYKPDWKEGEMEHPRTTDFYISEKALGELYRSVDFPTHPKDADNAKPIVSLSQNPIFLALEPIVKDALSKIPTAVVEDEHISPIFRRYASDLRFITLTHTLTDHAGVRLSEEEVVMGTILASCAQKSWRKERIYRMTFHAGNLVQDIKGELSGRARKTKLDAVGGGLHLAWTAWCWTMDELVKAEDKFGLNSFGIIALNTVFDCLEKRED